MPRLGPEDFAEFDQEWMPPCQDYLDAVAKLPLVGVELQALGSFLGEGVCLAGKGCKLVGECAIRGNLLFIQSQATEAQSGLKEGLAARGSRSATPDTMAQNSQTYLRKPSSFGLQQ